MSIIIITILVSCSYGHAAVQYSFVYFISVYLETVAKSLCMHHNIIQYAAGQ